MKLETERLILRNYTLEDIDDYYEYVSQENVGPRCGWPRYKSKIDALERLKLEVTKPNQFVIVLKENNKAIGSIELMDTKLERYEDVDKNSKEIGFLLSEDYWSKGIMTEACNRIVKYAFEDLKLSTIYICHYEANIGSSKVQDKIGFKIIGKKEKYRTWVDGTSTDLIERSMTKEEYIKRK